MPGLGRRALRDIAVERSGVRTQFRLSVQRVLTLWARAANASLVALITLAACASARAEGTSPREADLHPLSDAEIHAFLDGYQLFAFDRSGEPSRLTVNYCHGVSIANETRAPVPLEYTVSDQRVNYVGPSGTETARFYADSAGQYYMQHEEQPLTRVGHRKIDC